MDRACQAGLEVLNMTFHTMELIPRASPYVRTRAETTLYLRRLEKTLAYMIKKGFEATTLSGLYAEWGRHHPVGSNVLKSV